MIAMRNGKHKSTQALALVGLFIMMALASFGQGHSVDMTLRFFLFWAIIILEQVIPRNRYHLLSAENLKSITVIPFRYLALFAAAYFMPIALKSISTPALDLARSGVPFWAQVAVFTLGADFLIYVIHRAQHRFPFYWKFHQVHHAVRELSATANYRTHICELALVQAGSRILLFQLLGVSADVFMVSNLIAYTIAGPLSHANLDIPGQKMRWLNYIFVTPNFHAHHHVLGEGHCNFGESFSLWDLVFGTFQMPDRKVAIFGVEDNEFSAMTVLQQHMAPLHGPTVFFAEGRSE